MNSRSRRRHAAYRERLAPSLWTIVAAMVCAPMAALVFVKIGTTLALVIGAVVAVVMVAALIGLAPSVEVAGSVLRAGPARIDVSYLGEPTVLRGDQARAARGPGLPVRAWHMLRGGIDGLVVFPLTDPDDPAPAWVVSSRTPDRLAAAVRRAQLRPRTPHR
ncbi:MAG: DUF3093 domain-containing protein [Microbacterium sp.]|uniref:DUF3093 domain-containing protein n=1 Tax=Microbacterium sp. TaxID=51671 RepID=UPI0039E575E7